MWPISIIEICIYDIPHKLEYNIFEAFHLAPWSTYHLIFLNQHISLWDRCLKFLIFHFDELAFGFLGIIQFYFWSLSLFPSRILVCATGFCRSISLYIWRALFSKNKKIKSGKIYRHMSMHVSRSTKSFTNHSWQVWISIYNSHIDFKTSSTVRRVQRNKLRS